MTDLQRFRSAGVIRQASGAAAATAATESARVMSSGSAVTPGIRTDSGRRTAA